MLLKAGRKTNGLPEWTRNRPAGTLQPTPVSAEWDEVRIVLLFIFEHIN